LNKLIVVDDPSPDLVIHTFSPRLPRLSPFGRV
jgi:hypothetical protein